MAGKKIFQLSLLLVLQFVFFQIHFFAQASNEIDFGKKFQKVQLVSDMDFMIERYEAIHPEIYAYVSKDQINKERNRILSKINAPMTRYDFAKKIIPLVSLFKDGHTYMIFPFNEEDAYGASGGTYFPFDVSISEGKVFVKAKYTKEMSIKSGTEILSINGIKSARLLSEMTRYVTGDKDLQRVKRVERNFRRFLRILFGMKDSFEIVFNSKTKVDTKPYKLKGITTSEIVEQRKQIAKLQSQKEPFGISIDEKTRIGTLTINTFDENLEEKFESFLFDAFTKIRNEKVENLIIDVRQNNWGSNELAEILLSYIHNKPYTMYAKVEFRISSEVRNNKRFASFFESEDYKKHRKGEFIYWDSNLKSPQHNNLLFKGKVYLLTSGETYFAADNLAAVLKCNQMGTIIGEETGGTGILYGEIIMIILPNTKIPAYAAAKKFIQPCGKVNRGTIPDYESRQLDKDSEKGIDTVIEFTKDLIKTF